MDNKSEAGRYSSTYAHKGIAFEFYSWLIYAGEAHLLSVRHHDGTVRRRANPENNGIMRGATTPSRP